MVPIQADGKKEVIPIQADGKKEVVPIQADGKKHTCSSVKAVQCATPRLVPRGKRCHPVNLKDRQQQEWPKDQTQDPKRLAFSYKKVICLKIKV